MLRKPTAWLVFQPTLFHDIFGPAAFADALSEKRIRFRRSIPGRSGRHRDRISAVPCTVPPASGQHVRRQGRTDKASEILLKGLSISDSIGSIEYKHELLLALSELSSATGRKDEALEYYKKYHGYAENSSESRKKEHSRDLRTKKSVLPLKTK